MANKHEDIRRLGKRFLRILLAVRERKLVEPFPAWDVSHRLGNPGGNPELFVRVSTRPALYEIVTSERAQKDKADQSRLNRSLALYKRRIRSMKQRYSLGEEELEYLFLQQSSVCAICGDPDAPLCVDHNHTTGRVRGLLCKDCNTAIGLLKENPRILRAASYYVRQSGHEAELAEFSAWSRGLDAAGNE